MSEKMNKDFLRYLSETLDVQLTAKRIKILENLESELSRWLLYTRTELETQRAIKLKEIKEEVE